ncbi:GNAT family N-acetyltransferase [soil metagenome]
MVATFQTQIVSADALSDADAAAWRAIQSEDAELASPLLGPDFTRAVGRVRSDARVAIVSRDGVPVAFFPHHRRPGGFGRPIGAPFADYHGVVSRADAGLVPGEIVGLADLKAFRHTGLIDPHGVFEATDGASDAFAITLTSDPDAYLEAARAASPKKFKNWRRLSHRLAEMGPLTLAADTSQTAFDTVMRWKREQFERTGVQDVLRPHWAAGLMQSLFEATEAGREHPMTGLLLTLRAGDTLVGGHFGIRVGAAYHPWIASMSPDLAAFSPGQTFLDQAIRAMPGLGLELYDLGVGHDHYKRPFAASQSQVGIGFQSAAGRAGTLSRVSERAWTIGPLGRSGAVDKVRRRLDHIATAHPSLGGRVGGLIQAAAATRKRGLSVARDGGAGE